MHEISIVNDDEVHEKLDYMPLTFPGVGAVVVVLDW